MTLATACCQRNFDDLACRVSRLTEALIRDEQVPVAIKSHRCRKAQPSHDRLPCNCPAIQSHHHAGIGDVRRRREESGKCLQRIDLPRFTARPVTAVRPVGTGLMLPPLVTCRTPTGTGTPGAN